jgi:hypothetical protein
MSARFGARCHGARQARNLPSLPAWACKFLHGRIKVRQEFS